MVGLVTRGVLVATRGFLFLGRLLRCALKQVLDEVVLGVIIGEDVDDDGVESEEKARESTNITEQHEGIVHFSVDLHHFARHSECQFKSGVPVSIPRSCPRCTFNDVEKDVGVASDVRDLH